MSLPDLPLDELRSYRPRLDSPADAAGFWSGTLADAARVPVAATFEPVATGLRLVDTFDVCFAGYGGHPIKGWLVLPRGRRRARCPASSSTSATAAAAASPTRTCSGPWPATRTSSWTPGDRAAAGVVGDTPDPDGPGPSIPAS